MTHPDWSAITGLATVVSMVAYVLTAIYVRAELKSVEKDRFLTVTSELFTVWQSPEFMDSQLWLLHKMDQTTWAAFVESHRGDMGEAAFHRVGAFYDRVGTLVRMGLVNGDEILSTLGPYAIAVWQKIGPLVAEARGIENSILFDDFERLLPSCYECYVPNLSPGVEVTPFSLQQPVTSGRRDPAAVAPDAPRSAERSAGHPAACQVARPAERPAKRPASRFAPRAAVRADRHSAAPLIKQSTLRKRLGRADSLTLLDVRKAGQYALDPRVIPGAIRMPPDEIADRFEELSRHRPVVVYCA